MQLWDFPVEIPLDVRQYMEQHHGSIDHVEYKRQGKTLWSDCRLNDLLGKPSGTRVRLFFTTGRYAEREWNGAGLCPLETFATGGDV